MSKQITLDMNSPPVQYLCKKDKRLAKVISMIGSITYTTHFDDSYAFLIHEIVEQMLSVKSASTIYNRLVDRCGGEVTPNTVSALSEEQLREIGISKSKASCIKDLTENVVANKLNLSGLSELPDDQVSNKLKAIKGIGPWTAKMYLLFVLDRPDILPYEDVAFLQSFCWMYGISDRSEQTVKSKCKKWIPYSSTAARFLYRALDAGLTKDKL